MPIYEYVCKNRECSEYNESELVEHRVRQIVKIVCESCGRLKQRRISSNVGVVLKDYDFEGKNLKVGQQMKKRKLRTKPERFLEPLKMER